MSFPTEQCSVCGASCSYLPITDEVGVFDIFTAGYCLMPPTENDLILHSQLIISAPMFYFRWSHRKRCFSRTLWSSSNHGWSIYHRSVSSVQRSPQASSPLPFFNCYAGMLNVRAVSQLITSQWVIQQEISSVRVIFDKIKSITLGLLYYKITWESLSHNPKANVDLHSVLFSLT